MNFLSQEKNNAVRLSLYIQPKASQNRFCGSHGDDEMKLAITAPPVDGKANKAVVSFLAKFFGVAKSSITLKSGMQSRHKRFLLQDVTLEQASEKLKRYV
ncbi:MAG: YggU family protein [Desulfobulbaceae bacterium]|nr:YggU family protein [Desulfobulbaceae bacterium]